uniref:Uncharacterized protein n=1 Tax=viral metagenome TaxID=1070528 RepID=A0A6C0D972_9ZZZZ
MQSRIIKRINSIMSAFVILLAVMLIGLCKGLINDTNLSYEQNMTIEVNEGQQHILSQFPILITDTTVLPITLTLPVKAVMDNFAKARLANVKATRYNKNRKNKNNNNKNKKNINNIVNNVAPKSAPIIPTQPTTNKNTVTKPQKKDARTVKRTNLRNGYVSKPNKNTKTSSRNLRGTSIADNKSVYNPPNRYCYIMLRSIKALVEC